MAFAFAELLNQEAGPRNGWAVDVVQFDEPAFNVYLNETVDWGRAGVGEGGRGLKCTTAVHLLRLRIEANNKWKDAGRKLAPVRADLPRARPSSRIQQVSLECRQSHVPPS